MCVAVKFIYTPYILIFMIKKMENRKEGMRLHLLKGIPYDSDLMIREIGINDARFLFFSEEASKITQANQARKVITN